MKLPFIIRYYLHSAVEILAYFSHRNAWTGSGNHYAAQFGRRRCQRHFNLRLVWPDEAAVDKCFLWNISANLPPASHIFTCLSVEIRCRLTSFGFISKSSSRLPLWNCVSAHKIAAIFLLSMKKLYELMLAIWRVPANGCTRQWAVKICWTSIITCLFISVIREIIKWTSKRWLKYPKGKSHQIELFACGYFAFFCVYQRFVWFDTKNVPTSPNIYLFARR